MQSPSKQTTPSQELSVTDESTAHARQAAVAELAVPGLVPPNVLAPPQVSAPPKVLAMPVVIADLALPKETDGQSKSEKWVARVPKLKILPPKDNDEPPKVSEDYLFFHFLLY